ncbi:hypothetical protein AMELA_G00204870, partial [Ameiurus melas]
YVQCCVSLTGEASLFILRHSADLREECRFILLGGDDFTKNEACNIILRNGQSQQRADLEGWEVKENCVQGRHVTVAISPSPWLEHLKSFFFKMKVKSIKNEIQKCASVVFPGPNAFLLVIRDGCKPGKEHYLLKAVASVFGKEALDYSMVLSIRRPGEKISEPAKMKCVMKCGKRHHFLKDTDNNVQKLFMRVEKMTESKGSKFFIPSAYADFMETEFAPWEQKRISAMQDLLDEKDKRIEELKKELDASQRDCELKKRFIFQQKESRLSQQKESRLSQQKESRLSQQKESYVRKEDSGVEGTTKSKSYNSK